MGRAADSSGAEGSTLPQRRLRANGNEGKTADSANSVVVATRTPRRANCRPVRDQGRGHSKFDFDAPQFEDFTKPQYRNAKRLLELAVLPPEQRSDWKVEECSANGAGPDENFDSQNLLEGGLGGNAWDREVVEDDWFQRYHAEHEPSSPVTPAGPLITPDSTHHHSHPRPLDTPQSATRTATTTVGRSPLSPYSQTEGARTGSTHQPGTRRGSTPRTPLRSFGLRAKPMRVLASASDCSSSLGGISSAMQQAAISNSTTDEDEDEDDSTSMNTPTTRLSRKASARWRVSILAAEQLLLGEIAERREARRSSSIDGRCRSSQSRIDLTLEEPEARTSTFADVHRLSTSVPSMAGWSSIPETPPVLACGLIFDEDPNYLGKRSLPKDSSPAPFGQIKRAGEGGGGGGGGLRKIGLGSRAVRVERPTVELEEYRPPPALLARSKARSPLIKRVKVDARFCPAPPAIKSKNASPARLPPPPPLGPGKREKPVKLDELKKLLADHNQKLRPQINFNRRR